MPPFTPVVIPVTFKVLTLLLDNAKLLFPEIVNPDEYNEPFVPILPVAPMLPEIVILPVPIIL